LADAEALGDEQGVDRLGLDEGDELDPALGELLGPTVEELLGSTDPELLWPTLGAGNGALLGT
jgi:hypothetical protein